MERMLAIVFFFVPENNYMHTDAQNDAIERSFLRSLGKTSFQKIKNLLSFDFSRLRIILEYLSRYCEVSSIVVDLKDCLLEFNTGSYPVGFLH